MKLHKFITHIEKIIFAVQVFNEFESVLYKLGELGL